MPRHALSITLMVPEPAPVLSSLLLAYNDEAYS